TEGVNRTSRQEHAIAGPRLEAVEHFLDAIGLDRPPQRGLIDAALQSRVDPCTAFGAENHPRLGLTALAPPRLRGARLHLHRQRRVRIEKFDEQWEALAGSIVAAEQSRTKLVAQLPQRFAGMRTARNAAGELGLVA